MNILNNKFSSRYNCCNFEQYFERSALTGMSSESICDFSFFFFGDMVMKPVPSTFFFFAYIHN